MYSTQNRIRADDYTVCSAKAGVSTVPQSSIIGDLAASPVAQTYYTGFSLTQSDTGTYSTSDQVTGRLYAANDMAPTPSVLTSASPAQPEHDIMRF